MAKPVNLKGRSIPELTEALEYIIDQKLQHLRFFQEMMLEGDEIKSAKAYRDIRKLMAELRPVQYIIERNIPGMKEVFEQYGEK